MEPIILSVSSLTRLPAVAIIKVLSYLSSWDDRLAFSLGSKYVWNTLLRTSIKRQITLATEPYFNILKLKMMENVLITNGDNVDIIKLIKYSHNLRHISLKKEDISTTIMNNILRQGNRHGRPLQITLLSSVYSRFREKLKNYANKNCNVSIVLEEDDFTIKSPSPASESELNYVESILKQLERLENVDNYKLDVGEKKESLESILSKETISKHEVDDLIRYTKSRYVESILVFDDIWFYVTSIEIYLHYTPKVDDCTDDRTMDVVDRPKAYLHRKGKHYTFYFELSIYVGKIEFLVCGGFFGCFNDSNNKITPFLGTSIHKLPDNIKNTLNDRECKRIYIQFPGPKTTEHPRILQQYYKEDSNKIWRITSSFYYERAFNISNPLELVSLNKHHLKGSITPVLARFVLNCYSYKTVDTRMLQKLLSLLKKNKNKAEILGRIDWTDIKNWKEANDTANKSVGKKKPKPIMLINIISQLEDNRTREGFFVCDKCVLRKKEALWIFKDLVYKTLKKEKEKTIENYRI